MILVYPGQEAPLEKLKDVLKGQTIYCLSEQEVNETLGTLIQEAKGAPKQDVTFLDQASKSGHDQTLLYGVDMSAQDISALQSQVHPDAIVCLETKNNHQMTLQELYEEATQEALYFQKREELTSLLEEVDFQALQVNRDYFQCYALACSLLKQDELSLSLLDTAIQVMRSFQG